MHKDKPTIWKEKQNKFGLVLSGRMQNDLRNLDSLSVCPFTVIYAGPL